MRVLVACEYSGTVREAFRKRGHYAMSCDLVPTDVPGEHYQGDAKDIINDGWDLLIAHPPCTFMCNSSSKHLYLDGKKENGRDELRWFQMQQAAEFFMFFWNSDVPKIAIENPIMLGHAKKIIGVKQSQTVQPWMFGHTEQKATCLWLKGLPPLVATNNVKEEMMKLPKRERERVHMLPPSIDRWKLRSTTFQGIANAMADQWG